MPLSPCGATARRARGTHGQAGAFVLALTLGASAAVSGQDLRVGSDPPGATVYVDGEPRGQTPLVLRALAAGDHRVRIVKEGFLENSRVVPFSRGRSASVEVQLTPHRAAGPLPQVESPSDTKTGGSRKKALLIAAPLVVGGGVAAYMVATKNSAPVAGTATASHTIALMSATEVTFAAQGASDPDNDPLTYTWDFGDGGTATGTNAGHVYRSAGTFTAKLTVSDGKKSASTTATPVRVDSMQGNWRGVFNVSNIVLFNLSQSDTGIGGTLVNHTWANLSFSAQGQTLRSGRVSAPRRVVLETTVPTYQNGRLSSTYTITYDCTLNEALTSCTGGCVGSDGSASFSYSVTLTRQ